MKRRRDYPQVKEGEPFTVPVTKKRGEKRPTAVFWQQCCACRERHLFTFEVAPGELRVRTYPVP